MGIAMAFSAFTGPDPDADSGVFPTLVFVRDKQERKIPLDHTPFTVGRKVDKDLAIADPRVSRDHALIVSENDRFYVIDEGSTHGTFVNGERVQRKALQQNDRVELRTWRESSSPRFQECISPARPRTWKS